MSRIGFSESMRLFAVPSFLNGAARALDLGSTFDVYNESDSPRNADTFALASDWIQVGNDIAGAMDQYVSPKQGSGERRYHPHRGNCGNVLLWPDTKPCPAREV